MSPKTVGVWLTNAEINQLLHILFEDDPEDSHYGDFKKYTKRLRDMTNKLQKAQKELRGEKEE